MEMGKMDYRSLGAHKVVEGDRESWRFSVFAPHARAVSVVGDFNAWNIEHNPLRRMEGGIWKNTIEGISQGALYKFAITAANGELLLKADPYAFMSELRPQTASVLHGIPKYDWHDDKYMSQKLSRNHFNIPMNVYEVHLPSWKQSGNIHADCCELISYVKEMGYTHIELLPVMEYPLDDSWGYQVTGYYSITARLGSPENLMFFIDLAHQNGIGVLLDWVPAHFTKDAHGLRQFDGEPLFENSDPRRAEMPQWGTLLFDYERQEVRDFLINNALFYLKEFHADGLRVDAVSCMLYNDFCKTEWLPNEFGGRENLHAIEFIKELNITVHRECPGCLIIAEESSAYPKVTEPVYLGGLGFDFKWNMGFMNDTLSYFEEDSYFRSYHHTKLTFPMTYAFSEKHILPFSHDEVVCGKRSLIGRMQGSYEQQFEQLRLLLCYQIASPGKKLNFMGNEFGQFIEWDFHRPLDWFLIDYPAHKAMQEFTKALNHFYLNTPALHREDDGWNGFVWLKVDDREHSIIAFMRENRGNRMIAVLNFTPKTYDAYRISLGERFTRPIRLKRAFSTHLGRDGSIRTKKVRKGERYFELPLYGYEGAFLIITR